MAFAFRPPTNVTPAGYNQLDSAALASAVGLTAPSGPANAVVLQVEGTQAIRYRTDGTNPTTTVGMRLEPGQSLEFNGDLSRVKVIREAAGAILNCDFYDVQHQS